MTFRDDGPFGRIPMERELDEAIALLERCADEMNYDEFDDPAQRALQHDVSAFLASSVPAQPAAPEPHYAEQLGLNPAPGYAAPEPSAECHVGAPECPQCHAIESTVNGRLKPTDTWVSLLASRQELIARAEAAEAQLADARGLLRRAHDMLPTGCVQWRADWQSFLLTPAPSPGAGGGK